MAFKADDRRVGFSPSARIPVAWALLALILASCAHADLPAQKVTAAPVGTAKLPLKVAVLSDSSLTIHFADFYDKLNPALANLVRDALAADFQEVIVMDDYQSAHDADLLAIPAVEIPIGFRWAVKPIKLTITFLEPHTPRTIAIISSEKRFEGQVQGAYDHYATDLALAVIPPVSLIALPYIERHDAERFNASFGPILVTKANDVADQASKDPAIRSLKGQQPTIHPTFP
jgi:hypothetical protein